MKLYFTQIDPLEDNYRDRLERRGWEYRHHPFREVVFLEVPVPDFSRYDVIILSSKQAAKWLIRHQVPALPPLAVVGRATASLLESYRLFFDEDAPPDADSLVEALRGRCQPSCRLLFLAGERARDTIPRGLADYPLVQTTVYKTVKLKKNHARYEGGMVYFQAPSTVKDFLRVYREPPDWIGAIGGTTARSLENIGWQVHFKPSRPEVRYFVEELPDPETFEAEHRHFK